MVLGRRAFFIGMVLVNQQHLQCYVSELGVTAASATAITLMS
jgi:hypothetical protein